MPGTEQDAMALDDTGPVGDPIEIPLARSEPAAAAPLPGTDEASAPPAPRGAGRRVELATVLAAAGLSAVLASGATYLLLSATLPPATPSADVAAAASGTPASAQTISATPARGGIVAIAARARDWVVTITTEGAQGFSPFSLPSSGVGSGLIVASDGLILTNDHVVDGAGSLTVELPDGRHVSGSVVATDASHDLALVHADATGLSAAALGDSSTIQVGELAIAIGSPLGTFTDTVTEGIISGLDRTIEVTNESSRTRTQLEGLIQTDAAINPGNSGGPLLDATGSVVAIITAQAGNAQGVGFAVPINEAKALIRSAGA